MNVDLPMLREALLRVGFLSGSRAFGTERSDSDWDIVYSIDDTHTIKDIIEDIPTEPSSYFAGYTIEDRDGALVNLIPVHPHLFLCWYLATKAMRETLKGSGITQAAKKYGVFQGMVSLFQATVEERRNLDAYSKLKADIISGKL